MNLARLQNTRPVFKDQLYVYTLKTNNQKQKFKNQYHLQSKKKKKNMKYLEVNLTNDFLKPVY